MKFTPIFHGTITQGKLILSDPMRYLRHISSLEGAQIQLTIRKHKEKRSDQQNRWYWGVVVELLADHCGYTPEEMHEALKLKFLSTREEDDKGLTKIKSTTRLSTAEFADYTNRIVRWASETLGIYIPDPGQIDYS